MTIYDMASRYYGTAEIVGPKHNPMVLAMLKMQVVNNRLVGTNGWPDGDETAWCGAAMMFFAYSMGYEVPPLPLRARSWLDVGAPIRLHDARMGNDIVIFSRGENAPGPDVRDAQGHVALYAGHGDTIVIGLGGNQSNEINRWAFERTRVLGVRRLREAEPMNRRSTGGAIA